MVTECVEKLTKYEIFSIELMNYINTCKQGKNETCLHFFSLQIQNEIDEEEKW